MIELFRASVRIIARHDYSEEQVLAWAPDVIDPVAWDAKYRDRQAWVVVVDGGLAGFADLEPDGHLDMMYVDPHRQGCGVGTALLHRVERGARALDLRHLYTEASITARPFFERRGFDLVTPQTVHVRGQDLINFRMRKELR